MLIELLSFKSLILGALTLVGLEFLILIFLAIKEAKSGDLW